MEEIKIENLKDDTFDYKKHIVNKKELNNYIDKFHKGEIKKGYGLGIDWIDKYFVAKEYEFYAVVGKKGDGKTTIQQVMFLLWSIVNGLHWVVCFKENMNWSVKVNLLTTLLGKRESYVAKENPLLYQKASDWIDKHFTFLEIDSLEEGLKVGEAMIEDNINVHAIVFDPANSFDYGFSETGNEFTDGKKSAKELLRYSKKISSVHISQHPTMSGQRKEGDVTSAEAEGGWFFNKASFTYNINRTRGTSENRIQIENVRNKLTGGGETHPEEPLIVHWSPSKIDFTCGYDSINDIVYYLRKKHNPLNEVFELQENKEHLPTMAVSDAFGTDEEVPF